MQGSVIDNFDITLESSSLVECKPDPYLSLRLANQSRFDSRDGGFDFDVRFRLSTFLAIPLFLVTTFGSSNSFPNALGNAHDLAR